MKVKSKCPPGVWCIENLTLGLLFIALLVVIGIYQPWTWLRSTVVNNTTIVKEENGYNGYNGYGLFDPYLPPVKNDYAGIIPINLPTNINAVISSYQQVGIATPLNGNSEMNILPIMGRPLFVNRNKWQYYTISNQHNNVKLPVQVKGKNALTEYGVDQLYTGDTMFVEGYNTPFQVTIYENDTMRYLPVI